MEQLSGIVEKKSGFPWDKYKNPESRLVHNEILGWCLPELEKRAIESGWIVKRAGHWMVAKESIIASNGGGTGYSYNRGDRINVINRGFLAYKQGLRDDNLESLFKTEMTEAEENDFHKEVADLF